MGQGLTAFLGPEGSFTHEAALQWADAERLVAATSVGEIVEGVSSARWSRGVIAVENTVEGYVVPSVDALVGGSGVVAIGQVDLGISFDAFVRPDAVPEPTYISAHPHGLAQCHAYVTASGAKVKAAASNAAACRDLTVEGIALGPRLCGDLYGLRTLASAVEDHHGARTRFLRIAPRDAIDAEHLWDTTEIAADRWDTMLALTPTRVGPGVLARIATLFEDHGVNMSSLITRPLKAVSGQYVFVITCDGAPWQPALRSVLSGLIAGGDSLKTLGVFPALGDLVTDVDPHRVPVGSVDAASSADAQHRSLLW